MCDVELIDVVVDSDHDEEVMSLMYSAEPTWERGTSFGPREPTDPSVAPILRLPGEVFGHLASWLDAAEQVRLRLVNHQVGELVLHSVYPLLVEWYLANTIVENHIDHGFVVLRTPCVQRPFNPVPGFSSFDMFESSCDHALANEVDLAATVFDGFLLPQLAVLERLAREEHHTLTRPELIVSLFPQTDPVFRALHRHAVGKGRSSSSTASYTEKLNGFELRSTAAAPLVEVWVPLRHMCGFGSADVAMAVPASRTMTELNKVEGLITRFVQGRYVNAPDSQAANGFGPTNDTVFFASDESNRPPRALPFPLLVRDARHPLVVFSEHLRAKLRSAAPFAAEEVVFHFDSLEHYYGTFGNGYDDFFELGPHRKSVQYFQLTPKYPHSLLDRLRADWTAPLPSTQMAFSSAICVTNLVLHNCDTLREVGAKMFAGSTKLLRMEISNCRNLHTIRSGFCNSAQALRQVNISGNTRLNRIEAGFCAMCPKLDSVGLDGLADLRWVMTKFLANCPRLRALDISSFENTVQIGSHFLAECRSLSEVTFPTTWRVEDIGACFMRISDAGAEGGPGKSEVFGLQVIKLTMPLIRRIGSHFVCGHSLLTEFTAKIGAWLAEIGPMFLGENRRLETMRIEHSAIVDYVRFEKAVKNVMTPTRCIVGASLLENCPLIANVTLHFDYVSEGVHLADHDDVSCVLKRASLNTSVKPRLVA